MEKRQRPRWKTSFYFKEGRKYGRKYFDVVDNKSGQSLGHLVDLTPEGMRIISRSVINRGTTFDLRIVLPAEVKNQPAIVAKAECAWCEKDVNPEFYNAGFKISSISPPYVEVIEILIEESSG